MNSICKHSWLVGFTHSWTLFMPSWGSSLDLCRLQCFNGRKIIMVLSRALLALAHSQSWRPGGFFPHKKKKQTLTDGVFRGVLSRSPSHSRRLWGGMEVVSFLLCGGMILVGVTMSAYDPLGLIKAAGMQFAWKSIRILIKI